MFRTDGGFTQCAFPFLTAMSLNLTANLPSGGRDPADARNYDKEGCPYTIIAGVKYRPVKEGLNWLRRASSAVIHAAAVRTGPGALQARPPENETVPKRPQKTAKARGRRLRRCRTGRRSPAEASDTSCSPPV